MTRLYTEYEVRYVLMPEAVSQPSWAGSVPGFVEGQVMPNPYVDENNNYSPVGQVLERSLDVDVWTLEDMATKHVRLCDDTEDPDEPCVVCAEGADNSIYSQWVQDWLAEEYDISFTEEALDLLWSAETSGLTLDDWLEQAQLRSQS